MKTKISLFNIKENRESEMAGKIPTVYISQVHMGIRKQKFHAEELCAKVEMLYPVETGDIFQGERRLST